MDERPTKLKCKCKSKINYVLGKIVCNDNVENKNDCIQLLDREHMDYFSLGYLGYLFQDDPNIEGIDYYYDIDNFDTLINDDVIEIYDGEVRVVFKADSFENYLQVTNLCNSNCIMCPDTIKVRKEGNNIATDKLLKILDLMPINTHHLTITGGEPGMLKDDLHLILKKCKEKFDDTEFLILTNGRVFSDKRYFDLITSELPEKITFAIPLYSSNPDIHNSITRGKDSFNQTIIGIKRLLSKNIKVEIRTVVLKKNYKVLDSLVDYIIKEIPNVKEVNFMALEMLGNAFLNRDEVWVNFVEIKDYVKNATLKLMENGIIVHLYNFPLCFVDKKILSVAVQSISDYKVRYKDECENCTAKNLCGGFFFSTINQKDIVVKPIE